MFKVVIQKVDYDDYPIGRPHKEIGPFESMSEAHAFVEKFFPFDITTFTYKNVPFRHTVFVDTLKLENPEEYS